VSVACCQVKISASDWPLVQRSPTACVCPIVTVDKEKYLLSR